MRMPWGKFRGREIEVLPSSYLHWLARDCKNDTIATAADQEWQWRERHNCHFEEEED